VLDGETIVFQGGKPDFGALMSREQARTPLKVRSVARALPATYIVFDLLYENYKPLLKLRLRQRRKRLEKLVTACNNPHLVLSQGVTGHGEQFFADACKLGLEGVVAKRLSSQYLPGQRTDAWIKIKRSETIDCAIIGYVPSTAVKDDFRSLILAAHDEGELRCVGKVGTGINMTLHKKLYALMNERLVAKPLVPTKIKGRWIEAGLYCRVSCMERTAGGELRAPVFLELWQE
jgi:ATP-dependent DNA ligase